MSGINGLLCPLASGWAGQGSRSTKGRWRMRPGYLFPCRVVTGWLCPSPTATAPGGSTLHVALGLGPGDLSLPTLHALHGNRSPRRLRDPAPSLPVSLNPAHVFVNNPLLKLSSHHSTRVHHLFPARAPTILYSVVLIQAFRYDRIIEITLLLQAWIYPFEYLLLSVCRVPGSGEQR